MTSRHHEQSAGVREIHVGWRNDHKAWLVTNGDTLQSPLSFRLREHALAFARAVAHSRAADMVVRDTNGDTTRHAPDTLSYPRHLD